MERPGFSALKVADGRAGAGIDPLRFVARIQVIEIVDEYDNVELWQTARPHVPRSTSAFQHRPST